MKINYEKFPNNNTYGILFFSGKIREANKFSGIADYVLVSKIQKICFKKEIKQY